VAKWFRLLTSNHLALTAVGLNPNRDFGFFSCEEAIQIAYRTSAVLLKFPLVSEIMHRRAPEVFVNQKCHHMTVLYCVDST
jgi:hypothetical protein